MSVERYRPSHSIEHPAIDAVFYRCTVCGDTWPISDPHSRELFEAGICRPQVSSKRIDVTLVGERFHTYLTVQK